MSEIASTGDFVWTSGDPPPNDHTLNACLARVIGLKIITGYCEGSEVWVFHRNGEPDVWSPLTNPAQFEEAEAWVQVHHKIEYAWDGERWYVKLDYGHYFANGPDKKRAFALAIWEIMKCDNIQKTEQPVF